MCYVSVSDRHFDLIFFTETWLSDGVSSSELFPDGYTVFRQDRDFLRTGYSTGGGVLIAFKNCWNVVRLSLDTFAAMSAFIDIIGCKLTLRSKVLYIYVLYIPPDLSVTDYENFFEIFEQIVLHNDNIIVVGDFNIANFNNLTVRDSKSHLINSFIQLGNLQQVNHVRNINGRLLDLVLTNQHCNVLHDSSPLLGEDSHHPALMLVVGISSGSHINLPANDAARLYNFKKADFESLYRALFVCDWSFLDRCVDVNEACYDFYSVIYEIFDRFVPLRRSSKKRYPIWYTTQIIKNIKLKSQSYRHFIETKSDQSLFNFKQLRRLIKSQLRTAYREYLVDVERSFAHDPTRFWSYINNKRGHTRIPGAMHCGLGEELRDPQVIIESFATYFGGVYLPGTLGQVQMLNADCPSIFINSFSEAEILLSIGKLKNKLTAGADQIPAFFVKDCAHVLVHPLLKISKLILNTANFPDIWKVSRICPILKGGGHASDIESYRPIAILSNFAKVIEMALYVRLYSSVSPLLSSYQHGFIAKRSTVTNLAHFTQFTASELDNCGQVDVVYTDFSKAFDRIDHAVLLFKLSKVGFSNQLLQLLRSYLCNREQFVAYNGYASSSFVATSGVPQGSNLGPLLFLLFINDLGDYIQCEKLLFADDLKIFHSVRSGEDCQYLQCQINQLHNWCTANMVEMNINKCCVMTYTLKVQPISFNYSYDHTVLTRCSSHKDLGVVFDCKLSFGLHIEQIISSSTRLMGFILRTCRVFQGIRGIECLYTALVRSRLEYAALIWCPYYEVHKVRLEKLQRKFLKFLAYKSDGIYPTRGFSHETLLLRFSFQSLETRRHCSCIKFLFNLVHGNIDSPKLLSYLNYNSPAYPTRKQLTFYCQTPRTNVLLKSPIYSMCNSFNLISDQCHLDSINLGPLLKIVVCYFNMSTL